MDKKDLWLLVGIGIIIGGFASLLIYSESTTKYYRLDEYTCTDLELSLIQGSCLPRSEGWIFTSCYSSLQIKDSREIRCKN